MKKQKFDETEMIQNTDPLNMSDEEQKSILVKEESDSGTLSTIDAIQIIIQSLVKNYNVDLKKLDVSKLISIKGRVRGDLLQKMANKISH